MRRVVHALCFALVALSLVAGLAWAQEKLVPGSQAEITLSFAPVVKKVAPAVVNIFSKRVVKQRAVSPLFSDPFFRRFFGDSFGMQGVPRERM